MGHPTGQECTTYCNTKIQQLINTKIKHVVNTKLLKYNKYETG